MGNSEQEKLLEDYWNAKGERRGSLDQDIAADEVISGQILGLSFKTKLREFASAVKHMIKRSQEESKVLAWPPRGIKLPLRKNRKGLV